MIKTTKKFINGTPTLFKGVENHDGYWVSRCGKIFSDKSQRLLKTQITPNGYERVSIVKKKYLVHQLVVSAFIGKRPVGTNSKFHIDHIDGNKLNNHADNLRIISRRDNIYRQKNPFTGAHKTSGGKWMSQIRIDGKLTYLGTFKSREDAREAYLKKRFELQRKA